MLKNFFIISMLCFSVTNLYAGIANGGACNPNGLTSTSNAADIVPQDASCTSGSCSLSEKKCIAKYGLEKDCNRNAQCAEGTCFNSKCLLPAGSSCAVATNCSSGVCTSNKCAIATGGACNPNGLTSTSNAADIATQDASCASGLCSLGEKKCIDSKVALGLTCNRNAQCQTGTTCFNSKCLLPDGSACNPNGLTSTSNAADIAPQDASCTSGSCSLSEKKCIAKYVLEKACNRNAQCAEGTCFNSKCLLPAGSSCAVATNCSSGVCTSNKCT